MAQTTAVSAKRPYLDCQPRLRLRPCNFRGYVLVFSLSASLLQAGIAPENAALYLDFSKEQPGLRLTNGPRLTREWARGVLEFTTALQYAEGELVRKLDGVKALSIGGWFFPRRTGEQVMFCRGLPTVLPQGERMFPRQERWVNFMLGTDQRGFLMGTINGNGAMPFSRVTVNEVPFDAWSQLALVKAADGFQRFFINGTLVHSDHHAVTGGKAWPFTDIDSGEPVRLAMAQGGLVGEAWVFTRELSAQEISEDFHTKRERYRPALAVAPVKLREMNSHPAAGLWKEPITDRNWPEIRRRIQEAARKILGPSPDQGVSLDPQYLGETDCGTYVRRKISIRVQEDDRMPAYLLVPKNLSGRAPAVVCFYGTSGGAGKDTTVGLSGLKPGTPPQRNFAFAIDVVEAGFVAFAADYLRDGERVKPGRRPYDTTDFYAQFPDWSIHGKDAWDTSRAIDYLCTLDFVDTNNIGMTGHSYGGHSTIFTAAMEPRIKVAVANGPVSDFLHFGMHWGVPKGAGNSQSLPAMRPFVLDHTIPAPITFYEFTSLIAPRPLLVGQAAGERRPMEEENYAAVSQVYRALGAPDRVRYHWYAGDHDYPPEAREAMVAWFKRWFTSNPK